ncbi:transcriptional regulator [Halococcus sp. AFM35]|uniref:transcriptional regulator n=1 Tax=Halococcus sp. AFM35 TaxID=3421653 RepID=UPI003EC0199A
MSQVVPGRNRDEDSGRFQEEYPPEEVIAAIQNQDGYAGTASIADEIGATTESAYVKLRAMEDEGYVESQLVGQSRIWEVTEEDTQEE